MGFIFSKSMSDTLKSQQELALVNSRLQVAGPGGWGRGGANVICLLANQGPVLLVARGAKEGRGRWGSLHGLGAAVGPAPGPSCSLGRLATLGYKY